MDQPPSYTVFPNLHPTTIIPPTSAVVDSGVFALPVNSTRETVLLAWAVLLHGHVPADSVVFGIDDAEAAIVQSNGGKIEYTTSGSIHVTDEDRKAGRYSAVYFAAVSFLVLCILFSH